MGEQAQIEVGTNGKLIVFQTPGGTFPFDPPTAVNIAQELLNCARECGYEVKVKNSIPDYTPRPITDVLRVRLIQRCALMIRSMRNLDDNIIATHVVEQVLKNV